MRILSKYVVILRVIDMNCTCDGGGELLERVKIMTNQNNVAAGAGQILLLAGQFWPAARLWPTTDL